MLLLLVPVAMMTSCKDDEPAPDTAIIHGTITIDSSELWATWKDSGVVEVTIFPEFSLNPPAGWGDIPAGTFPGFLGGRFALGAPFNAQNPFVLTYVPGKTEYDYEIEVDPGTYSALAVGFRHNLITDASKKTATLGVHWGTPATTSSGLLIKMDVGGGQIINIIDDPAPSIITVEKGDNVEYNFNADFAFVLQWPFR